MDIRVGGSQRLIEVYSLDLTKPFCDYLYATQLTLTKCPNISALHLNIHRLEIVFWSTRPSTSLKVAGIWRPLNSAYMALTAISHTETASPADNSWVPTHSQTGIAGNPYGTLLGRLNSRRFQAQFSLHHAERDALTNCSAFGGMVERQAEN